METVEEIIDLELSAPQMKILQSRRSRILNMAGQGSGKTAVIGLLSGIMITEFPLAHGFIGANTEKQLSDSTLVGVLKFWEEVFDLTQYDEHTNPAGDYVIDRIPPKHFTRVKKLKRYKDIISFRDGTVVFVGALKNYHAHDGKEFAWAHLDETKDTKEEALKDVILGRLRQIGLWFDEYGEIHWEENIEVAESKGLISWNPLYIHTSPGTGHAEWLNEMFELNPFEDQIKERVYRKEKDFFHREFSNKAVFIYSAFHNKKHLAPNFLENQLLDQTAAKVDKLVYGLPFSKSGGEYYPSFERRKFVRKVTFTPQLSVHVSLDFNVVPYMTMICCQVISLTRWRDNVGNKFDEWAENLIEIEVWRLRVYKEYCLASPRNSTEAVCEAFDQDHDNEDVDLYYYGDASGLSRIPGLGSQTNFKILESKLDRYTHNLSKRVKMPNVSPLKRRDLLDKIFSGKIPEIEIEIDEECIMLIKDLEKLKQGINGKVKKKVTNKETNETYEELGHTSDALECLVSELFKEYLKIE